MNIPLWHARVKEHKQKAPTFILVGTKSDVLGIERQVCYDEAYTFANQNDMLGYMETSAKNNINVTEIIKLIDDGKISNSAAQHLFLELINQPTKTAQQLAQDLDLIQNSDSTALQELVTQALSKFPEKVSEYKSGKIGLLGMFVGEAMKLSKGKADPKILNQLVKEELEK